VGLPCHCIGEGGTVTCASAWINTCLQVQMRMVVDHIWHFESACSRILKWGWILLMTIMWLGPSCFGMHWGPQNGGEGDCWENVVFYEGCSSCFEGSELIQVDHQQFDCPAMDSHILAEAAKWEACDSCKPWAPQILGGKDV